MSTSLTDPVVLVAIVAGGAGLSLLVQARVQARLLRRRIATGAGTVVMDPATGLYSAAAAWQCIRAEANRAARLVRPLDVWVGAAEDAAELDALGRELVFSMPGGATGIRIGHRHLCVVSCAGAAAAPTGIVDELSWSARCIDPGEDAATTALAFVSEATVA